MIFIDNDFGNEIAIFSFDKVYDYRNKSTATF